MIPGSSESSKVLYVLGTVVLLIGVAAFAAAALIKRRIEEDHRDERYVRERRGEEVGPTKAPRIASVLQYAGVGIAAVGVLLLVAGWTLAPGQS